MYDLIGDIHGHAGLFEPVEAILKGKEVRLAYGSEMAREGFVGSVDSSPGAGFLHQST